jgi:outer membrane protein assembly factor BamB
MNRSPRISGANPLDAQTFDNEVPAKANAMQFHQIWSHDLHHQPNSSSVLSPTQIIVPARRTHLTSLDPTTGEVIWEARIRDPWGWTACTTDRVVYLNQHTFLQCFDQANGRVIWEHDLDDGDNGNIFGGLIATGDQILVGGWRGYTRLHCLDVRTGVIQWRLPQRQAVGRPLLGPWGIALPCQHPAELKILEWDGGRVIDRVPLPAPLRMTDRGSSVQTLDDRLLMAAEDGTIYLGDLRSNVSWTYIGQHAWGIATVTPTLLGQQLIFQDHARQLCCYDLSKAQLIWSLPIEHANVAYIPAGRLTDSSVVVGTSTGRLLIIDQGGQQRAVQTVAKRIMTPLMVRPEGQIVFGTKGAVTAYEYS